MNKSFLKTFFTAIIGGLISIFVYNILEDLNIPIVEKSFVNSINLSGTSSDFTFAAEQSLSGVVHVKTKFQQKTKYYSNPFDFFFGDKIYEYTPPPVLSSGSGVIISKDGYIVTNNHVIDKSQEIEVVLNDKRSYHAKLIGTDPSTDLAVLKIDCKNLPLLSYGNSDELKVGEWVIAVGNPFNLTSTVTAGIVSAKARNINILSKRFAIESFIQTDAAVNPGNSGGALVNRKGELVGINTAIASKTGSYVGYSFAIPVSIVKKIVKDIIEFGKVQRAFLGINIIEINSENLESLGMDKIEGIYVSKVNENSGADKSGMKKGDIILKVENIIVNNKAQLLEQISKYRPADKINITVKSNGKLKKLTIILQNIDGNTFLME